MAWPVTRADLYSVDAAAWNELVNAFSAWGGNVNAGNNSLSNLNTLNVGTIAPQSGTIVSIQAAIVASQAFANPTSYLNSVTANLSGTVSTVYSTAHRTLTYGTLTASGGISGLVTEVLHGWLGAGTGHVATAYGHQIIISGYSGGVIDAGYALLIGPMSGVTAKWAIYDVSGGQSRLSGKLTVTGDITPSAAHFLLDNTYTLKAVNSAGTSYPILGTYGDNVTFIRALDNGAAKGVRIEQWDGSLIAFFQQNGYVGVGVTDPTSNNGGVTKVVEIAAGNGNSVLALSSAGTAGSNLGGILEIRTRASVTGTQVLGQLNWTRDADVTAGKLTGHFELYVANDGVLTKSVIVDRSGRLGVGPTAPSVSGTGKFHHSGDTCRIVDAANAPANSAAAGNLGELRLSGGYLYYHDGTSWRRAAGSTF